MRCSSIGVRAVMAKVAVMVLAFGAVSGCTALATWPPTEGKAVLAPSATPCPQLMATSVSFTRQQANRGAPLVFNLPPGTEWKVWDEVRRQLGPEARMMAPGDAPVFDVRQVRLDGGLAEVDVVYATPEGVWQMATVHFTGAFGGHYRPKYFQRWFIPVDLPVCNTPPPPPPEPSAETPPSDPATQHDSGAAPAPPAGSSTTGVTGTTAVSGG